MAKDKRIGEIPGISDSAVVGLNRIGVVSMHDLLAAEFDRVAYIVDDYNEAARLVKEARKLTGEQSSSRRNQKNGGDSLVPGPLAQNGGSSHHSHQPSQAVRTGPRPSAPQPPSQPQRSGESLVGDALALASRGLSLAGPAGPAARASLGRRLNIAGLLLEHGAGEAEVAAGLLLEPSEAGTVSGDEITSRLGQPVEQLLEECAGLRAVPMLPTGKLPRYYLEMVKSASREAKRICAAHILVSVHGHGGTGAVRSAHLLAEAIAVGSNDELVLRALSAADEGERAAA